MRARQIVHVNIVADAGSIGRRIIGSKYLQLRAKPRGRAQCDRNQVGFRFVQFADFAAVIRTRCIEISQTREAKIIGPGVGLERLLEKQLRDSIRIYRLARSVFLDRNFLRFAVHRAGRRKYDLLHSGVQRRVQQRQSALDIIMKIFFRIRYRLADIGVRRKVHDGIASGQHSHQCRGIQHVAFDEFKSGSETFKARAEIIEDYDFMPRALQRPGSMTADVSRTANDQNDQVLFLSFRAFLNIYQRLSRHADTTSAAIFKWLREPERFSAGGAARHCTQNGKSNLPP